MPEEHKRKGASYDQNFYVGAGIGGWGGGGNMERCIKWDDNLE